MTLAVEHPLPVSVPLWSCDHRENSEMGVASWPCLVGVAS